MINHISNMEEKNYFTDLNPQTIDSAYNNVREISAANENYHSNKSSKKSLSTILGGTALAVALFGVGYGVSKLNEPIIDQRILNNSDYMMTSFVDDSTFKMNYSDLNQYGELTQEVWELNPSNCTFSDSNTKLDEYVSRIENYLDENSPVNTLILETKKRLPHCFTKE